MSRIRTIKPEFWTSAQVMECSPLTRLFFIGLWNFCDDHGRHPVSEKQLRALIFPGDDLSLSDVRTLISELENNDLITTYFVGGKEFFEVNGWRHQKIDRPQPARFPSPMDADPTPPRDHSSNDQRTDAEHSRPIGREGKGREGKGRDIPSQEVGNQTTGVVDNPLREENHGPFRLIVGGGLA